MNKFFLQSKTILGALIGLAGAFGYTLPFTNEEVEPVLLAVQDIAAFVLIVWGRVTATQPLGFKK